VAWGRQVAVPETVSRAALPDHGPVGQGAKYPHPVWRQPPFKRRVPKSEANDMQEKQNKAAIQKRLARLEGQIRGISRMIEEDRYCVDMLAQTAAVRSALKAVERLLIEDHTNHCLEAAILSGDPDEQRTKFREMVALLEKARD
jgi:DNA-binding FrmR family transcriptional regulator